VDAHGDMNTPASTTSGNVHGIPLAALIGPEPAELSKIGSGRSPKVRAEKTVLIGVRNLDPAERERIRDAGIHVFTMKDIDRDGIAKIMARALAIAGRDTHGIHVSFDLDVCDPAIAPGVGLVEVNPILDAQNQTAALGVELVLSAFGQGII
jgi:arginase